MASLASLGSEHPPACSGSAATVKGYEQQLVLAKEGRTGRRGTPGSHLASLPAQGQTGLSRTPGLEQNPLMAPVSFCFCSVGGLILDKTVSDPNFAGMAVFTPVINGEVVASAARGEKRAGEEDLGSLHYQSGF